MVRIAIEVTRGYWSVGGRVAGWCFQKVWRFSCRCRERPSMAYTLCIDLPVLRMEGFLQT